MPKLPEGQDDVVASTISLLFLLRALWVFAPSFLKPAKPDIRYGRRITLPCRTARGWAIVTHSRTVLGLKQDQPTRQGRAKRRNPVSKNAELPLASAATSSELRPTLNTASAILICVGSA